MASLRICRRTIADIVSADPLESASRFLLLWSTAVDFIAVVLVIIYDLVAFSCLLGPLPSPVLALVTTVNSTRDRTQVTGLLRWRRNCECLGNVVRTPNRPLPARQEQLRMRRVSAWQFEDKRDLSP